MTGACTAPAWSGEGRGIRAASLSPGVVVGSRYRVEEEIGAGAFGTVYSAWDRGLHRRVALKVYPSAAASILVDEAALQARAQHPNVMPLYDAGWDALRGAAYLVMPQYPGCTLAERLQGGALSVAAAVRCADQVSAALEFLHERRQVVHGDVKPGNIWYTPGGAALPRCCRGLPRR